MRGLWVATVLCLTPAMAGGSSSASFQLDELAFNAGGSMPSSPPASTSFRLTLASIGQPVARRDEVTSASYRMDAGFTTRYAPTGQPRLSWDDENSLIWTYERAADRYDLYRGLVSAMPGDEGSCLASNLSSPAYPETGFPAPALGWFYMVTATNRLGEEGTRGYRSDGTERPDSVPCP